MCLSGRNVKQVPRKVTVLDRVICRRQINQSTKNPQGFPSIKRFDSRLTFRIETQLALKGAMNHLVRHGIGLVRFDTGIDKSLEDLLEVTEQRY